MGQEVVVGGVRDYRADARKVEPWMTLDRTLAVDAKRVLSPRALGKIGSAPRQVKRPKPLNHRPIQFPVVQRLSDIRGRHIIPSRQVGDGPGDA